MMVPIIGRPSLPDGSVERCADLGVGQAHPPERREELDLRYPHDAVWTRPGRAALLRQGAAVVTTTAALSSLVAGEAGGHISSAT